MLETEVASGLIFLLRFNIKGAISATPLFLFTSGDTIIKLLKISTKKYLITRRNS